MTLMMTGSTSAPRSGPAATAPATRGSGSGSGSGFTSFSFVVLLLLLIALMVGVHGCAQAGLLQSQRLTHWLSQTGITWLRPIKEWVPAHKEWNYYSILFERKIQERSI